MFDFIKRLFFTNEEVQEINPRQERTISTIIKRHEIRIMRIQNRLDKGGLSKQSEQNLQGEMFRRSQKLAQLRKENK